MKRNGFTLVEVLAIIIVLSLIAMLVFPNIESVDTKKEKELLKIINVIENAGKSYFSTNKDIYKVSITSLINDKYLSGDITDPTTLNIMNGCVRVVGNLGYTDYEYGTCEDISVSLEVNLNGGVISQTFSGTYLDSTKIMLSNPTKTNYTFKGWEITEGNSLIRNNTLIIGTKKTVISALWE